MPGTATEAVLSAGGGAAGPAKAPAGLPERWYPLRFHAEQRRLIESRARFRVVPAGRRSGKTELAKRFLTAVACSAPAGARFFAGAPTWAQAKRIWWADLKALAPPSLVSGHSDGELWIRFAQGQELHVVGTDAAARLEGTPWDGGVLDEYGSMKPEVWEENLRPAMAERGGWCWFIGVPEGRNHYYRLHQRARAEGLAARALEARDRAGARAALEQVYGRDLALEMVKTGVLQWDAFTWVSADILPPAEVEAARRDMDSEIFEQEFEARFASFRGRAYKAFRAETHTALLSHFYKPDAPLVFCFDFNVEPGAAVVLQELELPNGLPGTAVIGEVHIPYDSDTVKVCRRLVADWEGHRGPVRVYGDATGGQRRTSAVQGHDWKLVRQELRGHFERIEYHVPDSNPPERERVNCVNARLLNAAGEVRLIVDPVKAPKTVEDFEGVRLVEGGSGEIAKTGQRNRGLTHWTDAVGYYIAPRWPIKDHSAQQIGRWAPA